MPKIDFTPKCRQCGRGIKLEETFDPCPQCGFENLKESCKEGQKIAEKTLEDMQELQKEQDRRMKDPDYEGPRFAGSFKKQRLSPGISRTNQIDQAEALSRVIREKDPKLENAFTPEVAENLLKKGGCQDV